jgi:hypothetical protein
VKSAEGKRLTVLVSSTVYGIEELLERVYALLTEFGYEVWMSHKGTMPVLPNRSNLQNCLTAVEQCDLFLGIITPRYGTGREETQGRSITHDELLKAIELNKPRWILAHDHVVFARSLLAKLGYKSPELRAGLSLIPSPVFEDLRVIDMYDAAIRHDIRIVDRTGNWVQPFATPEHALLFASAQFFRYQEAEDFVRKHFGNQAGVRDRALGGVP